MQVAIKKPTVFTKKSVITVLAILLSIFLTTSGDFALANEKDKATANSNSSAATLAGISATSDDGKGAIDEGKGLVYFMMAAGFVIIAGCLVVAGVKLAASGTGQKRAEALIWVGGAFLGAFIVYKAFDLLGYAIGFSS